jgi:hypothetical protein
MADLSHQGPQVALISSADTLANAQLYSETRIGPE